MRAINSSASFRDPTASFPDAASFRGARYRANPESRRQGEGRVRLDSGFASVLRPGMTESVLRAATPARVRISA